MCVVPSAQELLARIPLVIETERLTLRCPRAGDGVRVNAAVRESIAELRPWMHWAKEIAPLEVTERNMVESGEEFLQGKAMRYLIFLKGTDTLAGSTGLHHPFWEVPSFEIGYWVRSCYAGMGYATEAVIAQTEMAFSLLGARRMQIICDSLNAASASVARRAGYQLEGVLRNSTRHHLTGELRDEMVFSRVR
jgi:RimJ/RimL family protein N-acetyltransferase